MTINLSANCVIFAQPVIVYTCIPNTVISCSRNTQYTVVHEIKIASNVVFCGTFYSYVALYNYKPQKDDEIELKKGDFYSVTEKCQDGWFKGRCLKNANTGVFPGNYVQAVPLK